MKLSDIKVDPALIEQGDWVDHIPDLPGIRIKARGANNSAYRQLEAKLVRQIPRSQRAEGVAPEDQDRIASTLLLETVIIDVEFKGYTEDDGVTPLKWSRQLGEKLLFDPEYKKFQAGVAYAASVVAERRKADEGTEVKN